MMRMMLYEAAPVVLLRSAKWVMAKGLGLPWPELHHLENRSCAP